jgi:hypothetical protein
MLLYVKLFNTSSVSGTVYLQNTTTPGKEGEILTQQRTKANSNS